MQPVIASAASTADLASQISRRLRAATDPKSYANWIDEKLTLAVSGDELTVAVATPFLLAWNQRQFHAPLREAAREVLGPSARVRWVVDGRMAVESVASLSRSQGATAPTAIKPLEHSVVGTRPKQELRPASPPPRRERRLSELADFVNGPHSEAAFAAALRFGDAPLAFPGPFYLFGGIGLGKTHLLEGIARRVRSNHPALQVASFTAESFANYFTEALRTRTLPAFRQRFRSVDVLLVDDVDFLDGKRGLQEEFLHTIQHLESRGRVVAIAADCHPKLLTKTSEELVTRFLAGTVCRLDLPSQETRVAILKQKSARRATPLDASVLEMIAGRFRGSVRELEGALNCLEAFKSATKRPLSVTLAKQLLGDLERDCRRTVKVGDVERVVCEFFGVEPQAIRSANRARSVSQPRMLAMYLARKLTQTAYGDIGAHFGGRNHSTVIAAEKKVQRQIEETTRLRVDAQSMTLAEVIESLEARLRAS